MPVQSQITRRSPGLQGRLRRTDEPKRATPTQLNPWRGGDPHRPHRHHWPALDARARELRAVLAPLRKSPWQRQSLPKTLRTLLHSFRRGLTPRSTGAATAGHLGPPAATAATVHSLLSGQGVPPPPPRLARTLGAACPTFFFRSGPGRRSAMRLPRRPRRFRRYPLHSPTAFLWRSIRCSRAFVATSTARTASAIRSLQAATPEPACKPST